MIQFEKKIILLGMIGLAFAVPTARAQEVVLSTATLPMREHTSWIPLILLTGICGLLAAWLWKQGHGTLEEEDALSGPRVELLRMRREALRTMFPADKSPGDEEPHKGGYSGDAHERHLMDEALQRA